MSEMNVHTFSSRLGLAFSFQYNLILFFGTFLYAAALGSWFPALAGMIAEVIWLIIGSMPSTARWIERHREERAARPTAEETSALDMLGATYAARYEPLAHIAARTRYTKLDMTGVSPVELSTTLANLEETQRSFLRLCSLHQRLSQFLQSVPSTDLEFEAQRLAEAFAREKDLAVRMATRQSLGLVQRRLQHRELTVNMLRAVELRMAAVEQSFLYIQSQVLPLASALELKAEVEAVMARVSSVDTLEAGAVNAIGSADVNLRLSYPNLSVSSDSRP
jgi:hypothetical protein